MMALLAIDRIGRHMESLLACASGAFEDLDPDNAPEVQHLAPGGQVAWDNCCDRGGQLYVRMLTAYPSGPFPAPLNKSMKCAAYLSAATLAVGTIRCAHTIDDNGVPPTAAQMTADTLRMTADLAIIETAIRCCLGANENLSWSLVEALPGGPEGGCSAAEWTVTIGFNTCKCPEGLSE